MDWVERRRVLALALKEEGRPQEEIAKILGVSGADVDQWLRREVQAREPTRQPAHLNWMERRRALAHELRAEGLLQKEIADVLGVTQGAVSQWMQRESVEARKLTGRPPRLNERQKRELAHILAQHPQLSRGEIAAIIRDKWGVNYDLSHISRLRQQLAADSES